uniref:Ribosomal protein S7 n=2 Tax=Roya TaxID=43942 RepID=A0A6G9IEV2_9VIRI|nr:ribosomal protein S7 [Roya obtusa]YP_009755751.1 ribosomal protein S7 [Roya anglica]AGZ90395.1 ribosomal protein S7 [Roya obtusa]QIQ22990.1 ribosomal protein S7 [Roya anglica]
MYNPTEKKSSLIEIDFQDNRKKLKIIQYPTQSHSIKKKLNIIRQKRCLQKFINLCMIDGKKYKSYQIISKTLKRLSIHGNVIDFLIKAIDNVKPLIEVRKIRISGRTQLIPYIIPSIRQEALAIRWILEAALNRYQSKKNISLDYSLFLELTDAYRKTGPARKKRDDLHKLAEVNRGFAYYRWW